LQVVVTTTETLQTVGGAQTKCRQVPLNLENARIQLPLIAAQIELFFVTLAVHKSRSKLLIAIFHQTDGGHYLLVLNLLLAVDIKGHKTDNQSYCQQAQAEHAAKPACDPGTAQQNPRSFVGNKGADQQND